MAVSFGSWTYSRCVGGSEPLSHTLLPAFFTSSHPRGAASPPAMSRPRSQNSSLSFWAKQIKGRPGQTCSREFIYVALPVTWEPRSDTNPERRSHTHAEGVSEDGGPGVCGLWRRLGASLSLPKGLSQEDTIFHRQQNSHVSSCTKKPENPVSNLNLTRHPFKIDCPSLPVSPAETGEQHSDPSW